MQWKAADSNHDRTYAEIVALLTPRQAQVLEFFLAEASDVGVARRIDRDAQTVRNHMSSIQKKLGVGSRPELMKVALLAKMREDFLDRLG